MTSPPPSWAAGLGRGTGLPLRPTPALCDITAQQTGLLAGSDNRRSMGRGGQGRAWQERLFSCAGLDVDGHTDMDAAL